MPPNSPAPELETKPYLTYLDKEMSIMGILSTFAVAIPSFALAKLMGADEGTALSTMWDCNRPVFVAASGVSFISALAFYRQRSALAYWYGQIAMSISPAHGASDGGNPHNAIQSANGWSTWRSYMAGFYFLYLSLYLFGLGLVQKEVSLGAWHVIAPAALGLLAAVLSWYLRQRFDDNEYPEPEWVTSRRKQLRDILKLDKKKKSGASEKSPDNSAK